ncbi:MAG: hypothetical protein RLZZ282_291, partial [Verrucomicrobiota bacterium]
MMQAIFGMMRRLHVISLIVWLSSQAPVHASGDAQAHGLPL